MAFSRTVYFMGMGGNDAANSGLTFMNYIRQSDMQAPGEYLS